MSDSPQIVLIVYQGDRPEAFIKRQEQDGHGVVLVDVTVDPLLRQCLNTDADIVCVHEGVDGDVREIIKHNLGEEGKLVYIIRDQTTHPVPR